MMYFITNIYKLKQIHVFIRGSLYFQLLQKQLLYRLIDNILIAEHSNFDIDHNWFIIRQDWSNFSLLVMELTQSCA